MTIKEMRKALVDYCNKTSCEECKLTDTNVGHMWPSSPEGGCILIGRASEDELIEACEVIDVLDRPIKIELSLWEILK